MAKVLSKKPSAIAAREKRHQNKLAKMKAEKKASTQPYAKEYTYKGKTLSIYGWAAELGISRLTLKKRLIDLGWPVKLALTTPVRTYNHRAKNKSRGGAAS